MTPSGQTICLCMIVKDEALTIRRCLDSVKGQIDRWLIVDAGSNDGTPSIIRKCLAGIPGELIERPSRGSARDRSEALASARLHGDYSLLIDADEIAEVPHGFALPHLEQGCYAVRADVGGICQTRIFLVKASLAWRYDGVVCEYLVVPDQCGFGHLPISLNASQDRARRRDPNACRRDLAALEGAVALETDPFKIARYTFHIAQLHRELDQGEEAVRAYLKRSKMSDGDQEPFCSLLYAGRVMQASGGDPDEVLGIYRQATEACPWRAEALHAAAQFCRNLKRFGEGMAFARSAAGLALPATGLFIETWIYDYGALDELGAHSYWAGRYRDCLEACMRALERGRLPAGERSRFLDNMMAALERYEPNSSSPHRGISAGDPLREARSFGLEPSATRPGRPQVHICFISINEHDRVFEQTIATLTAALEDEGFRVTVSKNLYDDAATNIVVGSVIFAAKRSLLSFLSGKKYCVYQLEQLSWEGGHVPSHGAYLDLLRKAELILEYSPRGVEFLKGIAIKDNVKYLPSNFHRSMVTLVPAQLQDIDVLFYGTLTSRREHILSQLRDSMVKVVHGFNIYGEELERVIARSKVVVNIHAWDEVDTLETVRLSFLIANRCFVVSERGDHDPYGSTVVYAAYDDLAAACLRSLRLDRAERDRIAAAAFAHFSRTDFAADIGAILRSAIARPA